MIKQIRYSECAYAAPNAWGLGQILNKYDADHVHVISYPADNDCAADGVAVVLGFPTAREAEIAADAYIANRYGRLATVRHTWSPVYTDPARWPEGRPLPPDER